MARRKTQPVSQAETEVLRLVWQKKEATVKEVCDALPPHRTIAYATVHTLLRRLEKKGYVKHYARGKANVYYPAVKRESVIKRSVGDFLDRLFGGDPVSLMQFLARHGDVSAEDIDALRTLVEQDTD
jgi:predicted transcriptional regulator